MAFTEKISIVVADGHTLGYINQSDPAHLFTFREIQSLGAPFHAFDGARLVSNYEKIRAARPDDFKKFRVCENQFRNKPEYLYKR